MQDTFEFYTHYCTNSIQVEAERPEVQCHPSLTLSFVSYPLHQLGANLTHGRFLVHLC